MIMYVSINYYIIYYIKYIKFQFIVSFLFSKYI